MKKSFSLSDFFPILYMIGGNPPSAVANVLDFDILVNEFEFQSRTDVHFRTKTLEKGMNSLTLQARG